MALPPGWDTGKDATGRTYYVNHETQQTQWDPPTASAPPPSYNNVDSKDAYNNRALPQAAAVHATAVTQAHNTVPQTHQPAVIQQQPAPAPQVVVVQGSNAPQNAPQGGAWVQEKYCGIITWLVGIFIFPCVCCCPCDDRNVYIVNGTRYNQFGAVVPPGCC